MRLYQQLANVYDLIWGHKDYAYEVSHLEKVFGTYSKKVTSILDVGCGTGNHAKEFVARGYSLLGIDLNAPMVKIASQKVPAAEFLQADMYCFKLCRRFDAILCLFSTFNYCSDYQVAETVLKNFYDHLSDDGVLIIELIPSNYPLPRSTTVGVFPNKEIGIFPHRDDLSVAQICSIIPDLRREQLYTGSVFFIQENGHTTIAMDRHVQHLFSPHRLENMMKTIGFQSIEVFDSYTFKKYDIRSPRALIVSTKNSQKIELTKSTEDPHPKKCNSSLFQEQKCLN
ncbi:MAG: class I SAM-dependent DNA methyltransferase [Promethearchaeota archaeon]